MKFGKNTFLDFVHGLLFVKTQRFKNLIVSVIRKNDGIPTLLGLFKRANLKLVSFL
jgi:hypothetical protein